MKAMVLAAGLGLRMRPLTLVRAKPVLPVLNRPLLHWTLERLARDGAGFDTGFGLVPVVPTAILFDLGFGGRTARPLGVLAEEALADARRGEIAVGSVGCGTGATVGKANGLKSAMPISARLP